MLSRGCSCFPAPQQRGDNDQALFESICGMHSAVKRRYVSSQVPAAHVLRLDITPDIDAGAVNITVLGSEAAEGALAHVTVLDKHGKEVSQTSSKSAASQRSLAAPILSASANFKRGSIHISANRIARTYLHYAGW